MHDGELEVGAELVRRLVAEQFPELRDLPVSRVRSTGTVNAIFRIGDQLCARLPRLPHGSQDLDREWHWLPRLAPQLSLTIPKPVGRGRPADGYPLPWSVYRWIDGRPYADGLVADEVRAAQDLARFVTELRAVNPAPDAPPAGRRPLRELDDVTRQAIQASAGVIDSVAAADAWVRALQAPPWLGPPRWIHTDLLPPNLLVRHGRLHAVIDFGAAGVGDPAADVVAAWSVFGELGRPVFREALQVDDGTWERARGYALHQAALIIPYYATTNPGFVSVARRTVAHVLDDLAD